MSRSGGLTARVIFDDLVERPTGERSALLEVACKGDEQLRARVLQLLSADQRANAFLETPALLALSDAENDLLPAPKQIGRYKIRRVIASGGMGTVYEAVQDNPHRTVAVKVMRWSLASKESLRRFQYEAELLGQLSHPGIAQVFEAGTHRDGAAQVPYFAMEYVPKGRPITERAEEEHLDMRARLELFTHVCDAVAHAHRHGIIHRDLKPGNILVDSEGRVRIIDFGVGRAVDADTAQPRLHTAAGQLIGTLQYMSPEQCSGDPRQINTRSDVYSLGAVLYELLCGALPYDLADLTLSESTRVVQHRQPDRLSSIDTRLRGDVETIVAKALEKENDRRYASAHELSDDIRRFLDGKGIVARRASTVYYLRMFARRHKVSFAAVTAVLLALVAGVTASTTLYVRAECARRDTAMQRDRAAEATSKLVDLVTAVLPSNPGDEQASRLVVDEAASWLDGNRLTDEPELEADVRTAIGKAYADLGNQERAQPQLRKALAIRRQLHGDESPEVGDSLIELAAAMKWTAEAMPVLREAWEVNRKSRGAMARQTLRVRHLMGMLLRDGGQSAEAEAILRQVLQARREQFGNEDTDTAATLTTLGELLRSYERYDEAEPLLREALSIQRQQLGDNNGTVAFLHVGLGDFLRETGRLDESEVNLRAAIGPMIEAYGNINPWTARAKQSLGITLRDRGSFDEAEWFLRDALLSYDPTDINSDHKAACRAELGVCYTRMGSYQKSEEELSESFRILQAADDNQLVRNRRKKTIGYLVQLYDAWDKPDEAAKWQAKLSEEQSANSNR